MYVIQDNPDPVCVTDNGSELTPVATLKDEAGGVSHVCVDDHCYVLFNGGRHTGGRFRSTAHWYREAVAALMSLPADPDEARRQRMG